jgi:hypothetical protein
MQRVDICQSDSVSALAYSTSRNTITFRQSLRSVGPDVVLHEYGHKVMHEAYGPYQYRNSACATGHAPGSSVDTQCAWVEGWATFFSLAVRNSSTFRFPSGGFVNFSPYNSTVQNGTDEGRVVAALWGIYDKGDASASTRVPFNDFMSAMRVLKNNGACQGDCEGLQGYYWVLRNELDRSQKLASNAVMRAQYIFPAGQSFPEEKDEL